MTASKSLDPVQHGGVAAMLGPPLVILIAEGVRLDDYERGVAVDFIARSCDIV